VVERERERLARWLATHGSDARPAFEASDLPHAPDGPRGTVGAVAVDANGDIAAGGSTGGTPAKRPGRVGDTAVPGAGLFADNRCGAAACTGWGEGILRFGLARTCVELLRSVNAQDSAWLGIRGLEDRVRGRGGVVVVSRDGSIGFAFNTPRMALAYVDGEMGRPFLLGEGR
jgi:beta-aspartyl-peptidase (threonine type)